MQENKMGYFFCEHRMFNPYNLIVVFHMKPTLDSHNLNG